MQTVVPISADSAVPTALANLRQVLGDEAVITAPAELAFYSQDVYRSGQLPVAVIRCPWCRVVVACRTQTAICPRARIRSWWICSR
jgi:hypothetical protein